MLSAWMLASGLISTIFHSVQAFGSYPIAESLCYIDHGVAFSSFFYFFEVCGRPSWQVVGLGALAGMCLCLTSPGYVWFHSAWHIFIAMQGAHEKLVIHSYECRSGLQGVIIIIVIQREPDHGETKDPRVGHCLICYIHGSPCPLAALQTWLSSPLIWKTITHIILTKCALFVLLNSIFFCEANSILM
jgi:hypothetical protein